jgi:fluoride exporter
MTGVWIAGAGAVGALARFVGDGAIRRRWPGSFPWATLAVNVAGSLLLGLLTGLVVFRGRHGDLTLIGGTGFCGGFTTLSTASFETVRLAQVGSWARAVGYLTATTGLTLGAAAVGLIAVR